MKTTRTPVWVVIPVSVSRQELSLPCNSPSEGVATASPDALTSCTNNSSSSSSTISPSPLVPAKMATSHSDVEKRRKQKISSCIQQLAAVLEVHNQIGKLTRCDILQMTVNRITELKESNASLRAKISDFNSSSTDHTSKEAELYRSLEELVSKNISLRQQYVHLQTGLKTSSTDGHQIESSESQDESCDQDSSSCDQDGSHDHPSDEDVRLSDRNTDQKTCDPEASQDAIETTVETTMTCSSSSRTPPDVTTSSEDLPNTTSQSNSFVPLPQPPPPQPWPVSSILSGIETLGQVTTFSNSNSRGQSGNSHGDSMTSVEEQHPLSPPHHHHHHQQHHHHQLPPLVRESRQQEQEPLMSHIVPTPPPHDYPVNISGPPIVQPWLDNMSSNQHHRTQPTPHHHHHGHQHGHQHNATWSEGECCPQHYHHHHHHHHSSAGGNRGYSLPHPLPHPPPGNFNNCPRRGFHEHSYPGEYHQMASESRGGCSSTHHHHHEDPHSHLMSGYMHHHHHHDNHVATPPYAMLPPTASHHTVWRPYHSEHRPTGFCLADILAEPEGEQQPLQLEPTPPTTNSFFVDRLLDDIG